MAKAALKACVINLALAGCSTMPTEIEMSAPSQTIALHGDVVPIARCVQYDLLERNPLKGFGRGVGDHAAISENGKEARVWGPSTGLPMFSARFQGETATIYAQDMFPYKKAEIVDAVLAIIRECDTSVSRLAPS
jgi:hypothetical protein